MSFTRDIPVEFGHCDPAGIVFYPRYFEMLNSVVEAFFAQALGHSFKQIHLEEGCAVPTAHLEADFHAPSRLGDILTFTLAIQRVGGSSATFVARVTSGSEHRLTARQVIVWTGRDLRPARWPEPLARALALHLTDKEGAP
ncbi:MAG: thioesterase family protein [Albidovulum sp.]